MTTYSPRDVGRRGRCDDCGAAADVGVEADTVEDASGYRGDLLLCKQCLKARAAAGQFPFVRRTKSDGWN